jgi:predicted oxidoreductase
MANSLLFLEDMLFRTLSKEIEERHREVLALYSHDSEITNIANSIKRLCDHIFEIYKGIPDPQGSWTRTCIQPFTIFSRI